MDCLGKKEGLLLFWGDNVSVSQVVKNEFSLEIEIKGKDFEEKWWVIFVCLSTEDNVRKRQREVLKKRKRTWGQR